MRKLENAGERRGGLERRWRRGLALEEREEEEGKKESEVVLATRCLSRALETRESSRARLDHLFMRSEMIPRPLLCAVRRAREPARVATSPLN